MRFLFYFFINFKDKIFDLADTVQLNKNFIPTFLCLINDWKNLAIINWLIPSENIH